MRKSRIQRLRIVAALTLSVGVIACSAETRSDAGQAGESVMADAGEEEPANTEGPGEHSGSEARGESSEGGGEHARAESRGEHERPAAESEHGPAGEGEHGEEGEHAGEEGGHDEGGEESGVYIARHATWDVVRRGARLVLSFDNSSGSFRGTVENTTGSRLCAVRVEVHLSSGTELGPTPHTSLPTGETLEVELDAEGEAFDTWTAHPEMGSCGGV